MQVMEHPHTRITTEAKKRVNGWVTMDLLACFKQGGMEWREMGLVPLKITH